MSNVMKREFFWELDFKNTAIEEKMGYYLPKKI